MGLLKKILIGTGIGAAVTGAIVYVKRLNRTAAELVIRPSMMVHKVALSGITLRVDAQIKNPTRTQIKMKFPFVKLLYKDTMLGSSQAINKDVIIPAYGEVMIDQIMIEVPLLGIFSLGQEIFQAITQKLPIKFGIRTLTTIDLGWRKQPYESLSEIALNNK